MFPKFFFSHILFTVEVPASKIISNTRQSKTNNFQIFLFCLKEISHLKLNLISQENHIIKQRPNCDYSEVQIHLSVAVFHLELSKSKYCYPSKNNSQIFTFASFFVVLMNFTPVAVI